MASEQSSGSTQAARRRTLGESWSKEHGEDWGYVLGLVTERFPEPADSGGDGPGGGFKLADEITDNPAIAGCSGALGDPNELQVVIDVAWVEFAEALQAGDLVIHSLGARLRFFQLR